MFTGRSWGEFVATCARESERWSARAVDDALDALLEADTTFKDTRVSSDEQVLATLVLVMCGAAPAAARRDPRMMLRSANARSTARSRAAARSRHVAGAQASPLRGARHSGADSVFARARQLVANGNGAAGRVLVDSMIAAATPDSPVYGERCIGAPRWRRRRRTPNATIGGSSSILVRAASRRRAVAARAARGRSRRPSRGDEAPRAFLLEAPRTRTAPRGADARELLFDQNDIPRGCIGVAASVERGAGQRSSCAISSTTSRARCAANDVSARRAVRRLPAGVRRPPAPRRTRPRRAAIPRRQREGRFTLQVAAYQTKPKRRGSRTSSRRAA